MKKLASLLMSLALLSACVCGAAAEAAPQPEDFADSAARLSLEGYLEADPELTALMEKSIALAHKINPDPVTNPPSTAWISCWIISTGSRPACRGTC